MTLKDSVSALVLILEGLHSPFKRKSKLGPGPRKGTNKKANQWKCKCSDYSCQCKGKRGRRKRITIQPSYKKPYNAEYKAWVRTKGKKKGKAKKKAA